MKNFNFLPSIEIVKTKRDKHLSIYDHEMINLENNTVSNYHPGNDKIKNMDN